MTEPAPEDVLYTARDDAYTAQLKAEAAWWDGRINTPLSRAPAEPVQRYYNERMTEDPDRQWSESISDHGEFRRGCVLGAGPGHVEAHLLDRYPELRLTVHDISSGALSRLQSRLESEFPGRSEVRQEDLNFVSLPAEAFDIVVADSSMHHILNLEHVAFEVNRCLTSDGQFFLYDSVSESRFQFSDEKKRLYETTVAATSQGPARDSAVRWPELDGWQFSPFESIRSGEILDVFGSYLRETSVRTAGALLSLALFTAPRKAGLAGKRRRSWLGAPLRRTRSLLFGKPPQKDGRAQREAKMTLLIEVDRMLSDTGHLKPGLAFVTYRKRRQ